MPGWREGNGFRGCNFGSDDHGAEVVPSSPEDMGDMDENEEAEADGEPEMKPAGGLISTTQGCDEVQRSGLPDGHAGDHCSGAHQQYERISEPLSRVIFLADVRNAATGELGAQGVQQARESGTVGENVPPLAGDEQKEKVGEAIGSEEPHAERVQTETLGKVVGYTQDVVEAVWKEPEESE